MSERFFGSICVSDIIDLANKKHSAFYKGDNGKIYGSVQIWLNDEPDKYGNMLSCQLNPKVDKIEEDGRPYIGNFKLGEKKGLGVRDTTGLAVTSDLPVQEKKNNTDQQSQNGSGVPQINDLPF